MKLLAHLAVTGFVGAIGAAVVLSTGLDAGAERSALLGVEVSTALGFAVLVFKALLVSRATSPNAVVRLALAAQVMSFLARLAAVGAGAALAAKLGASPVAFTLSFLALFFGQQVVELKYMTAARAGLPQGT